MTNGLLLLAALVGASPIDINVGRQLFVDDYLIASTQGLVRVYSHPRKEFDRPLIMPETPNERPPDSVYGHRVAPSATLNSGGLWWDPRRKVFRLWYEGGWISKLYSFWVSRDATGKSGGYLAAGGPDYPGLRDL